jgi:hypothetical protein
MGLYQFPASLGGGLHESAMGEGVWGDRIGFDLPELPERVWLPKNVLRRIVEPTEPDEASIVLIHYATGRSRIYQRFGHYWYLGGGNGALTPRSWTDVLKTATQYAVLAPQRVVDLTEES